MEEGAQVPGDLPSRVPVRVDEMIARFQLKEIENELPKDLPLGLKQRLSLAAAVVTFIFTVCWSLPLL